MQEENVDLSARIAKRKVIKPKTVGLKIKEIEAKARTVIKEAGE